MPLIDIQSSKLREGDAQGKARSDSMRPSRHCMPAKCYSKLVSMTALKSKVHARFCLSKKTMIHCTNSWRCHAPAACGAVIERGAVLAGHEMNRLDLDFGALTIFRNSAMRFRRS